MQPPICREQRLALVLWDGSIGGAETMTAALAARMRGLGADARIVFVSGAGALSTRLRSLGVPFDSLGLARGRSALPHARRFAVAVRKSGPDGAILVERGMMALALRAGGYRAPIVAVEHGAALLQERGFRRLAVALARRTGALAASAEVAVSDFMLREMRRAAVSRTSMRIYNGIEPESWLTSAPPPLPRSDQIVVGAACRLTAGKGLEELLTAVSIASRTAPVRLVVAGDGPARRSLEALALRLGVTAHVQFLGWWQDMVDFWRRCSVAVIPSSEFVESFSMSTLEAMASERPVVATANGAIPELVVDGETGLLVPPGDTKALSQAIIRYASDEQLRAAHGAAGRARAFAFHIDTTAEAYLALCRDLAQGVL